MKKLRFAVAMILVVTLFVSVFAFPIDVSAEGGEPIVRMWLCETGIMPKYYAGHAFLYFENLTDHTVTVGKYQLPAGEGVSLSSHAVNAPKGIGVYYNVESAHHIDADLYAASADLDAEQLEVVNRKITSTNHWDPIFNCVWYAVIVWNAGPGKRVSFCWLPIFVRLQLTSCGAKLYPFRMFDPGMDRIYIQTEL